MRTPTFATFDRRPVMVALALRPAGGAAWLVARLFFVENLFVYTLQALLPPGFNDGATLLYWWRRR